MLRYAKNCESVPDENSSKITKKNLSFSKACHFLRKPVLDMRIALLRSFGKALQFGHEFQSDLIKATWLVSNEM